MDVYHSFLYLSFHEVRIIENNLTLEEVDMDIDADMDMDFEVEVGIREVEVAGDRKPADSITK